MIKSYPNEVLLAELRRAAELVQKPKLTGSDFTRHSGIAYRTMKRRFGSWRQALEQAGLSNMYAEGSETSGRRRSDEELLEEIERVAAVVDTPMLWQEDFKKHSGISHELIRRRFGGWRMALERAGLGARVSGAVKGARNRVSDQELVEELRRVAGLVEGPVFSRRDFDNYSTIDSACPKTRFGSWRAALEQAGLGHMYSGSVEGARHIATIEYSDEELLEEIRRVAHLLECSTLRQCDMAKHSGVGQTTFSKRFGTWQAALKRAGLERLFLEESDGATHVTRKKYTDEQLLAELRRVANSVGKPVLTRGDFSRHSGIDADAVGRRFGGWQSALSRAGLCYTLIGQPVVRNQPYVRRSKEELLEELRRVAALVPGRELSRSEFTKHSEVNAVSLAGRFGGWRAALELAGLSHMFSKHGERALNSFSDEELLDELRRVASCVGKAALTKNHFTKHSAISVSSLELRLGNWSTALERAGLGHLYFSNARDAWAVDHRKCTDEDLLEYVRQAAEAANKPVLTRQAFAKYTGIDSQVPIKRFGGWRTTLERAGIGHMYSRTGSVDQDKS